MFDRGIEIKTPAQIESMRKAGLVVAATLDLLRTSAVAGISTAELDVIAHDHIRSQGATSNFLGYGAHGPSGAGGFTGVICTSVNDEVVHGIPGPRTVHDGDIISIDCGAVVDGWHGDAAITVAIGDAPASQRPERRSPRPRHQAGQGACPRSRADGHTGHPQHAHP